MKAAVRLLADLLAPGRLRAQHGRAQNHERDAQRYLFIFEYSYSEYRCAMGKRRPMPNALVVTFNPGAACWRLYSLRSTLFAMSPPVRAAGACFRRSARRAVLLDVRFENRIQHFVRRQRIGILLIRPQLGRRRLGEHAFRNRAVMPPVGDARERIHHGLRHIADHRRARRTCRHTACSSRPPVRSYFRWSAPARRSCSKAPSA